MNKSSESFRIGVLNLVNKLNTFNLPGSSKSQCFEFLVENQEVGVVLPNVAEALKKYNETFIINETKITFKESIQSFKDRTDAMESVLLDMREKKLFKKLAGWRNEHFNVKSKFSSPSLFTIERSAASLFGFKQYGCHVNGYIKKDNTYMIWIAKRSKTKQTYPGMLDNFTGGGLTAGLCVIECAKKELEEEAGLSEDLAKNIKSVDAITYVYEKEEEVCYEGEFVFDIKLPNDFKPQNKDGEVEDFYLMTIEQVKEALIKEDFKPNSAAVTLGFLIRKGLVNPDNLPNYLEILEKLHHPGL